MPQGQVTDRRQSPSTQNPPKVQEKKKKKKVVPSIY
jgi:hypothetical protein